MKKISSKELDDKALSLQTDFFRWLSKEQLREPKMKDHGALFQLWICRKIGELEIRVDEMENRNGSPNVGKN